MSLIGDFLKRKDVVFSVQRYLIDGLGAMARGLFASLIVGLIFDVLGKELGIPFLRSIGSQAMAMMGPAIGVAVAIGLKASPLVIFSSTVTGMAGAALGGPAGAFVAAVLGIEVGKLVSGETGIDIILTPAATISAGYATAVFIGPRIAFLMEELGERIMWATELHPIPMGIIIAVVMGLALTAPISSAALAIMTNLSGLAAGAATVGCAAQMIGFAVASYRDNGLGGLFAQGIGTSMLQIPNIVRNPWILLPPTAAGAILGPFATTIFHMNNVREGAGMGTSGFVGQIGTIQAMGFSLPVLGQIVLLHFIAPALITILFAELLRALKLIKAGDMKL